MLKRDSLKALQLTDEQIDAVMAQVGKDVEAYETRVSELQTETDGLKTQIKNRDKDIKALKSQAGDNAELTQKYSDLQDKYKADTETLSGQLAQTKLDNALDNALVAAKVRNPKTIRGVLNMDDIKLNDQGDLVGLNDQIDTLKESDGYLFDEGTKTQYEPAGGATHKENQTEETQSVAEMAAEARIIK